MCTENTNDTLNFINKVAQAEKGGLSKDQMGHYDQLTLDLLISNYKWTILNYHKKGVTNYLHTPTKEEVSMWIMHGIAKW